MSTTKHPRNVEIIHDRLAEIPELQRAGVVTAVVDDPYEPGSNIAVLRATRDDPLAGMFSRGSIDLAQMSAGRKWQQHWEDAEIGAVRAIDPTKEPVDGKGPPPAPFTERKRLAMLELRQVSIVLGWEGNRIVNEILGDRLGLFIVAERHNKPKKYMGQRFRECLETMAKMWMLA